MRCLVTGAGGFIGAGLVQSLLAQGNQVWALDLALSLPGKPGLTLLPGTLTDATLLDRAFATRPQAVFHLASVPGGRAEVDPGLNRAVNLDATFKMMHRAAALPGTPVFVFASSNAVYGTALPDHVTDATPPAPASSYGAAKLMAEVLLADLTRRGQVCGMSLRLPGVVARPAQRTGAVSIFLSDLIRDLAQGLPVTCPVSPGATVWLTSHSRAVAHLVWAAGVAGPLALAPGLMLPALQASIADLIRAISDRAGRDMLPLVTFSPDPDTEALFGRYPPVTAARALAAGFAPAETMADLLAACRPMDRLP